MPVLTKITFNDDFNDDKVDDPLPVPLPPPVEPKSNFNTLPPVQQCWSPPFLPKNTQPPTGQYQSSPFLPKNTTTSVQLPLKKTSFEEPCQLLPEGPYQATISRGTISISRGTVSTISWETVSTISWGIVSTISCRWPHTISRLQHKVNVVWSKISQPRFYPTI